MMPRPKRRSPRKGSRIKLPTLKQWGAMLLGSDRPGHLFAAMVTGAVVTGCGVALLPVTLAAGVPGLSAWIMQVGGLVVAWEWACTPDVDVADKRNRLKGSVLWGAICCLWYPYAKVIGHRNKLSHSLAYGLPCRLGYFCILPIAGVVGGLIPFSAIAAHSVTVVVAAAIGDTVHMFKDDYSWEEMKWGK